MPKSYNQKMKILYVMKALLERTDEEHVLTMQDMLADLEQYGIKAERKSIYDDMEALRLFGMDIILRREQPVGYYLASRCFELPELKLLVDAVQSSKFITTKKSNKLIKKLESLTGKYEAQQLQRQVFVSNRIKTMNESIYYNVDRIHAAISANVQIRFQYYEWTVTKEVRLKKDGDKYCISPWALTWEDENYYLLGYDAEMKMVKHYRVDKMLGIESTQLSRVGKEHFERFDLAEFSKKTFGMFGGTEKNVKLKLENRFIGVAIDRFGKDAHIRKLDEGHFLMTADVVVSQQFFAWLLGMGTGIQIIEPQSVREEYQLLLRQVLQRYEENR